MKKLIAILFALLIVLATDLLGQVPQGIPYQAVARNTQGQPLANRTIKVRFTIRDSIPTGTVVFSETHSPTTTDLGLFSLNIGMGTPTSGSFSSINWGINSKFLKVEVDSTGSGSSYLDYGTQQMMSVPYAMYSSHSASSSGYGPWSFLVINNAQGTTTYQDITLNKNFEIWNYKVRHNFACCSGGYNGNQTVNVSVYSINGNTNFSSNSFLVLSHGDGDRVPYSYYPTTINNQALALITDFSGPVWNSSWERNGHVFFNMPAGTIVRLKLSNGVYQNGTSSPDGGWTTFITR